MNIFGSAFGRDRIKLQARNKKEELKFLLFIAFRIAVGNARADSGLMSFLELQGLRQPL